MATEEGWSNEKNDDSPWFNMASAGLNRSATWSNNKRTSRDRPLKGAAPDQDQAEDDGDENADQIGHLAGVRRHQSLSARHDTGRFSHLRGNSEEVPSSEQVVDVVELARRRSRSSTLTMHSSSSSSGSIKSPIVSTTLQRTPWSPTSEEFVQLTSNTSNSSGSSPAVAQSHPGDATDPDLTATFNNMLLSPANDSPQPVYSSPSLYSPALQQRKPSATSLLSLNTAVDSEFTRNNKPKSASADDVLPSPTKGPSSAFPYVRPIGPKQDSPMGFRNDSRQRAAATAAPGETANQWQRQKSMIAGNAQDSAATSNFQPPQPTFNNFHNQNQNFGNYGSDMAGIGIGIGSNDFNQGQRDFSGLYGNTATVIRQPIQPHQQQSIFAPFSPLAPQFQPNSPTNVWESENNFGMTRPPIGFLSSPQMSSLNPASPHMLPTSPSLLMPTSPLLPDVNILAHSQGYNPVDFDCHPRFARFCVIKSFTEDDIHKSIKHQIWSSTKLGNQRLDRVFREGSQKGPVYLFYSVNGSGHFAGIAEMLTPVDDNVTSKVWASEYKGIFKVRWIFIKDVPNAALRHLRLTNTHEQKPVTSSRDSQEVPYHVGIEMLRIITSYHSKTTLLQDFTYYDLQEQQKLIQNQIESLNTQSTVNR